MKVTASGSAPFPVQVFSLVLAVSFGARVFIMTFWKTLQSREGWAGFTGARQRGGACWCREGEGAVGGGSFLAEI